MIVLFTTALIPDFYETRKLEYLESFNTLTKMVDRNDIKIIECFLKNGSFFEDITNNVYYSNIDNNLLNKGVKESKSLIKYINNLNIDDEEIIIKHTGRYLFISDFFIKVSLNMESDIIVRNGEDSQYFTGTFAIKFKYLKLFLNNLNLNEMERRMINIEKELYNFVKKQNLNCVVYDKIYVYSNINNQHKYIW